MNRARKHKKPFPGIPLAALASAATPVSLVPSPRGSERPLVGYGLLALAVAVLLSAGVVCSSRGSTAAASHAAPAAVVVQAFHQPTTLDELLTLPAAELAKVDIARMNLLCGEGLPGCGHIDLAQSLAEVDAWAARVREATDRQIGEFLSEHDAAHSEAQYRMMMVMRVLSKGYGSLGQQLKGVQEGQQVIIQTKPSPQPTPPASTN